MQPSIMCLGSPIIDISININQDFLTDTKLQADFAYDASEIHTLLEKLEANGNKTTIGGSVTNTARIIKWIGKGNIAVTYLGAIGNDKYGRYIQDELIHEGIEAIFAVKENEKTARCTVLLHHDKRTLCTELGASRMYTVQDLDHVIQIGKYLKATGFVYFSETLVLHNLLNNKNEKNEKFQELKIEETLIKLHTSWMGTHNNKLLIITDGENPAMLLTKTSLKKFKVRSTNVKDANGAGDAFAGGFIAKYLERLQDLHKKVRIPTATTSSIQEKILCDRKTVPNNFLKIDYTEEMQEIQQYDDDEVDLDECMKCALWAASEIVQNTGCNFDRNKSFT